MLGSGLWGAFLSVSLILLFIHLFPSVPACFPLFLFAHPNKWDSHQRGHSRLQEVQEDNAPTSYNSRGGGGGMWMFKSWTSTLPQTWSGHWTPLFWWGRPNKDSSSSGNWKVLDFLLMLLSNLGWAQDKNRGPNVIHIGPQYRHTTGLCA